MKIGLGLKLVEKPTMYFGPTGAQTFKCHRFHHTVAGDSFITSNSSLVGTIKFCWLKDTGNLTFPWCFLPWCLAPSKRLVQRSHRRANGTGIVASVETFVHTNIHWVVAACHFSGLSLPPHCWATCAPIQTKKPADIFTKVRHSSHWLFTTWKDLGPR